MKISALFLRYENIFAILLLYSLAFFVENIDIYIFSVYNQIIIIKNLQ